MRHRDSKVLILARSGMKPHHLSPKNKDPKERVAIPGMNFDDLVEKKEIVFHSKGLRDCDMAVLNEVLLKSKVLEELNLSCNRISLVNDGFTKALARNHTLRVLYLNQNKVGVEGTKKLVAALRINKTLEKLGLDGNQIGDEGAKSLAGALKINQSLQEISLKANGIGDWGAQSLASFFEDNRSIHKVGLCGNKIGQDGAQKLADGLEPNLSIKTLNLGVGCSRREVSGPSWVNIQAILDDPKRKFKRLEAIIAEKDKKIAAQEEEIASKNREIARKNEQICLLKADLEYPTKTSEGDAWKGSSDELSLTSAESQGHDY